MADFTALKTAIQNAIKQNGNEEITGNLLQEVLLAIVTTLGDGSINDLITALGSEATTRQQADGTLQQNIDAEAQSRSQADTALGGRIDGVIESINAINAAIGNGYVYAGIATPSSTPTTGKVFYLALTAGTYTHFNSLEVPQGINILKNNGSTWLLDSFLGIDDAPTPSSNNLVKSSGVFNDIMTNGPAFDLTAYNNGTTYADLNAALTALNALPAAYKRGGMSVKYVQTSDNKYVQFRLMADSWSTNTDDWAIADEGVYVENPVWVYVMLDSQKHILGGFKTDGSFEFSAGVPTPIRKYIAAQLENFVAAISNKVDKEDGKGLIIVDFADMVSMIDNPEWLCIELDEEGHVLRGTKKDGTTYSHNLHSETIDEILERIANIDKDTEGFEIFDDPEERLSIDWDTEKKIVSFRDKEGILHENAGIETAKVNTDKLKLTDNGLTELEQDLKNHGFTGGQGDWSDKSELYIPEPTFAIVNITNGQGNATMPHAKFVDYKYYMQVWDMNGNYFKKEVIMNGQGNSSMSFLKDNFAVDMCNNNGWDDDDTFKLKIGDWVPQDSFHFKAFYNDFVRGSSIIAYKVADKIEKSRGPRVDRPWKKALLDTEAMGTDTSNMVQIDDLKLQFDTDAKCHPDGFPCAVYVEGSFYGLYAWSLKKHRDNYHQDKGVSTQIHLDGDLTNAKFWNLNLLDWTGFEVRNPKDLVYLVPRSTDYPITKKGIKAAWGYDADVAQAEIAGISAPDSDIEAYDVSRTYSIGEMCKNNKRYFISIANDNIGYVPTPQKKAKNIWDTAAADGHWLDITHTNTVKTAILNLCTRMDALSTMSIVETSNGNISIGDFMGAYRADVNFTKGNFILDGNTYYMSLHTTNTGHPLTDTNYWQDITTEVAAIKEYFADYFDKENLIDYQITQMVTGDTDGYGKNWQWVTYDGVKWYVTEYDKDMSFGNHYTGQFLTAPIRDGAYLTDRRAYWIWGYLKSYPIGWVVSFYTDEIKERWQWLYQNGIITSDAVIKELTDWCSRIGEHYFEKEFSAVDYDGVELGALSPCNRDDYVDNENWERTNERITSGNFSYVPEYTYQEGDSCYYGKPGQAWGFKFIAKKETTGNPPITQFYDEYPYNLGYRDSIWRFMNYIEETVSLQNDFINSLL